MPKKKGEATRTLDQIGIQAICDMLRDGMSYGQVARATGQEKPTLLRWIEADPDRSASAREAKIASAREWDERAEQGILTAMTPFELARAKELAHHYRWRAKCYSPKEYGEKVQAEHSGPEGKGIPVEVTVVFGKG